MFKNQLSEDTEYILAAISYLPFVAFILIFTSWKKQYFVKYHAAHAIIIYLSSFFFFAFYISAFVLINLIFGSNFNVNILWGLVITLHFLFHFIYVFYLATQAYLGRYLIIPIVTKLYYIIFHK